MRLRFWIGLTAVLLLAAGSVAAAAFVYLENGDDLDRREEAVALRAARQAEAAVELSLGQLASGGAFLQVGGKLNRHGFDPGGRSLLRQGVLAAAGYVPRVTDAERPAYERRNGFPITERGQLGVLLRAARRPVYFPLTYLEVDRDSTPALGYDLRSNPDRFPDLRRARDSGESVATQLTSLVLGGQGISVYQPLYRGGDVPATRAGRRDALLGFLVGSIAVADLAATAAETLPPQVDFQLAVGDRILVGDGAPLEEASAAPLDVAGQPWQLVVRDPASAGLGLPLLLAVVGVSLSALLAALILAWSRNERMAELQREASEDPLTGLKNRRRFEEELEAAMARSRRDGSIGAVLMLDLDHFKQVNDTHGHPAGDRLIREVAEVLRRRARRSDVLARLGGDEFALVLPRSDADEARVAAEAIAAAIRDHVPSQEGVEPVTACVGVAMFGADPRISAASVVSEADTAMYAAKDGGRDDVRVFDRAAVG